MGAHDAPWSLLHPSSWSMCHVTCRLLHKRHHEPIKLIALGILTAILFFVSLEPGSTYLGTYPNGELGVQISSTLTIAQGVITLFICCVFAYFPPKMHRAAPESMKVYTRLAILSGFLFAVVVPGSVLLRVSNYIPRLETFLAVVAMVPWTIALVKEPRLAYILPFKVSRLIVFETKSGQQLYERSWVASESSDPDRFSKLLTGISGILHEAVQRGAVREIKLAGAILLLQRSDKYPVACVLIASNSTQTLRQALNEFAEDFYKRFAEEFDDLSDPQKFDTASELVEEHFAFIPV